MKTIEAITVPLAEMPTLIEASREPCHACGCKAALNPHRMDRRKVDVLADLARYLRRGDYWVRVESGRGMRGHTTREWTSTAYNALCHVTRLGWFGLAEQESPRSAHWRVTASGLRFLRGDHHVPERILCRQGRVVYESVERVYLAAIDGVELDAPYWDAYPWSDMEELAR